MQPHPNPASDLIKSKAVDSPAPASPYTPTPYISSVTRALSPLQWERA